jgi:hypothetical protein
MTPNVRRTKPKCAREFWVGLPLSHFYRQRPSPTTTAGPLPRGGRPLARQEGRPAPPLPPFGIQSQIAATEQPSFDSAAPRILHDAAAADTDRTLRPPCRRPRRGRERGKQYSMLRAPSRSGSWGRTCNVSPAKAGSWSRTKTTIPPDRIRPPPRRPDTVGRHCGHLLAPRGAGTCCRIRGQQRCDSNSNNSNNNNKARRLITAHEKLRRRVHMSRASFRTHWRAGWACNPRQRGAPPPFIVGNWCVRSLGRIGSDRGPDKPTAGRTRGASLFTEHRDDSDGVRASSLQKAAILCGWSVSTGAAIGRTSTRCLPFPPSHGSTTTRAPRRSAREPISPGFHGA